MFLKQDGEELTDAISWLESRLPKQTITSQLETSFEGLCTPTWANES